MAHWLGPWCVSKRELLERTADGDFDADINKPKCREEVHLAQAKNLFVLVRCDGLWLRTDVAAFLLDYYVPGSKMYAW